MHPGRYRNRDEQESEDEVDEVGSPKRHSFEKKKFYCIRTDNLFLWREMKKSSYFISYPGAGLVSG
jgi:hypothetical protein